MSTAVLSELSDLAEEYLQNALQMEARIRQLESQASRTISLEVRRKLRRRINALHVMVCESRQIAFELEHYYDKVEDKAYDAPKPKPKRGRQRKKYSATGYGVAAPAAVERGRNTNKRTVSGIRTTFLGRNSTGRNCK